MYHNNKYIDVVNEAAELSMQLAVDATKKEPDYNTKGEVYVNWSLCCN